MVHYRVKIWDCGPYGDENTLVVDKAFDTWDNAREYTAQYIFTWENNGEWFRYEITDWRGKVLDRDKLLV